MSTRFHYCLNFIKKWEGERVDDPADRGGRTAFGITQRVYDKYRKTKGQAEKDVWEISQDEVDDIYWSDYWLPAKCSLIPEPLDLLVFDTAVNMGVGRSAKFLQAALGVTVDGAIGPKTIEAMQEEIAAGLVDDLCSHYIAERQAFYQKIVERDESQKKFIKGWMNRLASAKKEIDAA